ncbi:MAG: DNA-binding protein WhiA [Fusobacteriales bacterium]|jgi:DNA-binding protein WhiA|nr:DNA-binding protein WhiA [Fusobacteriales bacterium]
MSYSANVKSELFNMPNENNSENLAELLGIFMAKNSIKENEIRLSTENTALAKRVYSNMKKAAELTIQLRYLTSKKLGFHKVYEVIIPFQKGYTEFLKSIFEFKNLESSKDENIFKGLIKGYFLSCGYIKSPEKGYALDFFIDTEDAATFLYYLFKKIGKRVFQTDKKNKNLVYIRNSEDILDILIIINAVSAFFKYEDTIINKEIRNKVNRNMNWEIANETRKISTSEKQLKMIEKIDKAAGLNNLSGVLQETARMRIENPDLSLQELADLMNISKSGIRNRFRRLIEYYEELMEDEK